MKKKGSNSSRSQSASKPQGRWVVETRKICLTPITPNPTGQTRGPHGPTNISWEVSEHPGGVDSFQPHNERSIFFLPVFASKIFPFLWREVPESQPEFLALCRGDNTAGM